MWLSIAGTPPAALGQKPLPPAMIQSYPGGVAVVTSVYDPTQPTKNNMNVVYSSPTLLADTVNQVWTGALPSLKNAVEQSLNGYQPTGKPDPHLYNVSCTPAQKCILKAGTPGGRADGSLLALQLLLQGNSVSFKSTLPPHNAVDWGGDPSYQVTFDLAVTVWIQFPSALTGPISVLQRINLNVSNVNPKATNGKANILDWAAGIFNINILGKMQSAITAASPGNVNLPNNLSASLASALTNSQLAPLANVASRIGLVWEFGTNAQLTALGAPSVQGQAGPFLLACVCGSIPISNNRPGWVTGVISWNQSVGQPASPTSSWGPGFKIQAYAQSGAAILGRPAPPGQSVGVVQACSYGGVLNNAYGMCYVLGNLPLNVPLWVVVTDSGRLVWQGPAASKRRFYQANGWGGKITIRQGSSRPMTTPWYQPPIQPPIGAVKQPGGGSRPTPNPGPRPKPILPAPFPPAGNNPTGAGGVSGVDFSMFY
jgi:hypothetical protein